MIKKLKEMNIKKEQLNEKFENIKDMIYEGEIKNNKKIEKILDIIDEEFDSINERINKEDISVETLLDFSNNKINGKNGIKEMLDKIEQIIQQDRDNEIEKITKEEKTEDKKEDNKIDNDDLDEEKDEDIENEEKNETKNDKDSDKELEEKQEQKQNDNVLKTEEKEKINLKPIKTISKVRSKNFRNEIYNKNFKTISTIKPQITLSSTQTSIKR